MKSPAKDRKRSVLLIGPTSPPYGGPETIVEGLLASPLFNSLYTVYHVNTRKELTPEQRSRLRPLNLAYNVSHLASIVWTIVRYRPNIVFVFLAQNPIAFARDAVFVATAAILGRRIIASREGSYFQEFYEQRGRFSRWLIRRTLKLTACLRVESEMIRSQFDGIIEPNHVRVCRTGIDPGPLGNLPLRQPSDCIRILFMANVSVAKGAVDLVRAVAELKNQYAGRVELRLIGGFINNEQNITGVSDVNNAETQIRHAIEKYDLSGQVVLPGPKYGLQKIEEFAKADVFVLPSYSEGLSNALLEAIAAGLPVIATRVGALPECVTDGVNGYLVEPGDWKAVGRRLAQLANDSDLRGRMGLASSALCREKFSMDEFVKCLSNLFVS